MIFMIYLLNADWYKFDDHVSLILKIYSRAHRENILQVYTYFENEISALPRGLGYFWHSGMSFAQKPGDLGQQ